MSIESRGIKNIPSLLVPHKSLVPRIADLHMDMLSTSANLWKHTQKKAFKEKEQLVKILVLIQEIDCGSRWCIWIGF